MNVVMKLEVFNTRFNTAARCSPTAQQQQPQHKHLHVLHMYSTRLKSVFHTMSFSQLWWIQSWNSLECHVTYNRIYQAISVVMDNQRWVCVWCIALAANILAGLKCGPGCVRQSNPCVHWEGVFHYGSSSCWEKPGAALSDGSYTSDTAWAHFLTLQQRMFVTKSHVLFIEAWTCGNTIQVLWPTLWLGENQKRAGGKTQSLPGAF